MIYHDVGDEVFVVREERSDYFNSMLGVAVFNEITSIRVCKIRITQVIVNPTAAYLARIVGNPASVRTIRVPHVFIGRSEQEALNAMAVHGDWFPTAKGTAKHLAEWARKQLISADTPTDDQHLEIAE